MKIDKPNKPSAISSIGSIGSVTSRTPARGKSNPSSAQHTESTNVSLGSTAAQLNIMENSIMGTPVANAEKVTEIRQAINEGRFKVDSEVVADRLIESARDLAHDGE